MENEVHIMLPFWERARLAVEHYRYMVECFDLDLEPSDEAQLAEAAAKQWSICEDDAGTLEAVLDQFIMDEREAR